jgi:hypothetical protein
MPLLHAPRDDAFVWHPVSMAVNKVANDDAQMLLPISAAEAEALPAKKVVARKAVVAASDDGGQGSLF